MSSNPDTEANTSLETNRKDKIEKNNNHQQQKQQPFFKPSKFTIDPKTGEKWRICAGIAVLNSQNQLLVGERLNITNSWQCPQGGVDIDEVVEEAAARELYEEVGLSCGVHVVPWKSTKKKCRPEPVRYGTTGTNSWLEREGFVGQELHWVLFRYIDDKKKEDRVDGNDDHDLMRICNLGGLNGEKPEFSRVKWENVDDVVRNVWEKKREPYLKLQEYLIE